VARVTKGPFKRRYCSDRCRKAAQVERQKANGATEQPGERDPRQDTAPDRGDRVSEPVPDWPRPPLVRGEDRSEHLEALAVPRLPWEAHETP
jgi:hypothetical protein